MPSLYFIGIRMRYITLVHVICIRSDWILTTILDCIQSHRKAINTHDKIRLRTIYYPQRVGIYQSRGALPSEKSIDNMSYDMLEVGI